MLGKGSLGMFHAPWLLSASVAAFLVGPALHQAGRRVVAWRTALDGFALVAVGGLAALHLLPEALLHGGLVGRVVAPAIFCLRVTVCTRHVVLCIGP